MGLWIESVGASSERNGTSEDYVVLAVGEDVTECLISEEDGRRIKHIGLNRQVDTFEIRGDEDTGHNLAFRRAIFLPSSRAEILFVIEDLLNKVLYAKLPRSEGNSRELVYAFAGHRYAITCFTARRDRLHLVTCDEAGSIRLWHTLSGKGLAGLDFAHGDNVPIRNVSFLDETTLATSDHDHNLFIWSTAGNESMLPLRFITGIKPNIELLASTACKFGKNISLLGLSSAREIRKWTFLKDSSECEESVVMKVSNSRGRLCRFQFDSNFKLLLAHFVPRLESFLGTKGPVQVSSKPVSEENVQECYLFETSGWELVAEFRISEDVDILGLICSGQGEDFARQVSLIHHDPSSNQLLLQDLGSIVKSKLPSKISGNDGNSTEEIAKDSIGHTDIQSTPSVENTSWESQTPVPRELRVKAVSRKPKRNPCDLDTFSGTVKVTKHEPEKLQQISEPKNPDAHARGFNDTWVSKKPAHPGYENKTILGDSLDYAEDASRGSCATGHSIGPEEASPKTTGLAAPSLHSSHKTIQEMRKLSLQGAEKSLAVERLILTEQKSLRKSQPENLVNRQGFSRIELDSVDVHIEEKFSRKIGKQLDKFWSERHAPSKFPEALTQPFDDNDFQGQKSEPFVLTRGLWFPIAYENKRREIWQIGLSNMNSIGEVLWQ